MLNFKRIEIIPNILFDHSGMKWKSVAEGKLASLQICGLETKHLNNHWVKEEIKREIRKYLERN